MYICVLMAAVLLSGCRQNDPAMPEGQSIRLTFSMNGLWPTEQSGAARRVVPGDPGKDDFVAPSHLYFILWCESAGGTTKYMKAIHTDLSSDKWVDNSGTGLYLLKKGSTTTDITYEFTLPQSGQTVQTLKNNMFYVFAVASNSELTFNQSIGFTTYTAKEAIPTYTEGTLTLDLLKALAYQIPARVTTPAAKQTFFRSLYSTALGETGHNQLATTTTILLRHTASKFDLQWECDPTAHPTGLTLGSTWTIACNSMPATDYSLFRPGAATGTSPWSETLTIDEGRRYSGRYVTYLPMPETPTFTVTSSDDAINPEGANAEAKKIQIITMKKGASDDYATWMRALWTIK